MKLFEVLLDPELDEMGRWVQFVPGAEFRVARIDNKKARDYHRQQMQAAQDRHGKAKVPFEERERIDLDAFTRHVVTDWRGDLLAKDDGTPVPYSPERAAELLVLERSRDLRTFLNAAAMDSAGFTVAARKDAAGNSPSA